MGISKEHEGEGEGEQAQERVWSMCRRWAAVWIKEEKEKKEAAAGGHYAAVVRQRRLGCGRAGVRACGQRASTREAKEASWGHRVRSQQTV